MQVVLRVHWDEQRFRRDVRHLFAPQVRMIRWTGAALVATGLVLAIGDPTNPVPWSLAVIGVLYVLVAGRYIAWRAMRLQAAQFRQDSEIAIDDDWLTMLQPLVQTRMRWQAFTHVAETPDSWHLMFGKMQGFVVPKDAVDPARHATFEALLAARIPRR